jgi:hypothetical protein
MKFERSTEAESQSKIFKILFLVGVFCSCLIVLAHQNLPFLDTPNHLADYYLLTRDFHSPLYQQFYVDNFRLIPNMGVDVVMALIGRIVDPAIGLRLLIAAMICVSSFGYAKLSRLRNDGHWHPAVILIPVTFFSFSMLLGFLNFVLAASILPWAIVVFEQAKRPAARSLSVLAFTLIFFFCHLMVAVIFLLIIGVKLISEPKGRDRAITGGAIFFSLVLMAGLYRVSSVSDEHSAIQISSVTEKLRFFFFCLSIGPWWIPLAALLAVGFGLAIAFGPSRLNRSDVYMLLGFLALYLVCPFGFKITANMDGRIPPLILSFLLAFLTSDDKLSRKSGVLLGYALFAIVVVDLVSIEAVVKRSDDEGKKIRAMLRPIPAGDALFVVDMCSLRSTNRSHSFPSYRMMPYYTMIDRPLFISGLFAYPSQQPIILRPGLEGLGYASKITLTDESVDSHMTVALKDLASRRALLKSIGVMKSWLLFINYDSTGFPGPAISGTVFIDKTYLLAHVEN